MSVLWFLFPTDVLKVSQVFLAYEMFSPGRFKIISYMEIKGKNDTGNQNGSIPFLMFNHHFFLYK